MNSLPDSVCVFLLREYLGVFMITESENYGNHTGEGIWHEVF